MDSPHPRYPAAFNKRFENARARLGLTGQNFDHFFREVENVIGDYPYEDTEEVPESDGILMRPTRVAFPDLPPLYVYYRVEHDPDKIVFLSLSEAWSELDLPPQT